MPQMTTDRVNPENRIKELVLSDKEKQKQLEEKKAELEKKKKELEELERQREKDTHLTKLEIARTIEEIELSNRERFQELDHLKRMKEAEKNLEQQLLEEAGRTQKAERVTRAYGEIFQEIMQGRPDFYDITNYNVMNRLESIAMQSSQRTLNKKEQEFIEIVQYHAERLKKDDFYRDKEGANYLKQELAQIDFINKQAKKMSGIGDYQA